MNFSVFLAGISLRLNLVAQQTMPGHGAHTAARLEMVWRLALVRPHLRLLHIESRENSGMLEGFLQCPLLLQEEFRKLLLLQEKIRKPLLFLLEEFRNPLLLKKEFRKPFLHHEELRKRDSYHEEAARSPAARVAVEKSRSEKSRSNEEVARVLKGNPSLA